MRGAGIEIRPMKPPDEDAIFQLYPGVVQDGGAHPEDGEATLEAFRRVDHRELLTRPAVLAGSSRAAICHARGMGAREARAGWLLDEVAFAGRENLDAVHVARYDSIEDAAPDDEVALLTTLGLRPDSVVVDIGTGTGQFALAVAPFCDRVVAVDVSPAMLSALTAKIDRVGVRNVDVVAAGFLTYEHSGRPADVVYSRYALHHIPDFWKGVALTRLRAALRPGGVLRIWDVVYHFDPAEAPDRLEAWCATAGPSGSGGWSRDDLEEHVRDEHSTYTWVFEALAQRAGFHIEQSEYSDDGIFARYVLRRPAEPA